MQSELSQAPKSPLNKTPLDQPEPTSLANVLYWQTLAALVGFAISLSLQMIFGFQLLVGFVCGEPTSGSEFSNCYLDQLSSGYLVSLALTSALAASLGVWLVGALRKVRGSFLFSAAVTYVYFAFLSMQNRYFFEDTANSEPSNGYLIALLAILGCVLAAVVYHLPKWILTLKLDSSDQKPSSGEANL